MHTACVWSEKTTVCRIFSCQCSLRSLPLALAHSLVGPQSTHSVRSPSSLGRRAASRRRPSRISSDLPISLACLTEARVIAVPSVGEAGGEYRARTGDLLVANQALSQLS